MSIEILDKPIDIKREYKNHNIHVNDKKKCNVYSLIENINYKNKIKKKNSLLIFTSLAVVVCFVIGMYSFVV